MQPDGGRLSESRPMSDGQMTPAADWLKPPEEQQGLSRFVEVLRERAVLIAIITATTTAVAILYVLTATKVYEAEADLLISPVSSDNPAAVIAGLIQESPDPTRDVETAARLATTLNVAAAGPGGAGHRREPAVAARRRHRRAGRAVGHRRDHRPRELAGGGAATRQRVRRAGGRRAQPSR